MLKLQTSFLRDVDPKDEQPKSNFFFSIVKGNGEVKMPRYLCGLLVSKRNQCGPFFRSLCAFSRTRSTPGTFVQDFFSSVIENCELKKTFY